jgi:aminopeptidase N
MSLTQVRAETRSKWIRQNSIEYDFHIILNQGTEFHGLAEISFYLETPNIQSLPLDFSCKNVHLLQVNQQVVEADVSEDRFLLIHNKIYHGKNLLHRGKNRVTIIYSGDYDTSGEGCVTYTETTDTGKTSQYLYTQFEAYAANMVFPCFDQPDLKAPMKLSVVAPSIWRILSNEHPQSSTKFEEKGYIQHSKLHNHSKHFLPRLF